jgi:hypothetical protein
MEKTDFNPCRTLRKAQPPERSHQNLLSFHERELGRIIPRELKVKTLTRKANGHNWP